MFCRSEGARIASRSTRSTVAATTGAHLPGSRSVPGAAAAVGVEGSPIRYDCRLRSPVASTFKGRLASDVELGQISRAMKTPPNDPIDDLHQLGKTVGVPYNIALAALASDHSRCALVPYHNYLRENRGAGRLEPRLAFKAEDGAQSLEELLASQLNPPGHLLVRIGLRGSGT